MVWLAAISKLPDNFHQIVIEMIKIGAWKIIYQPIPVNFKLAGRAQIESLVQNMFWMKDILLKGQLAA